MNEFVERRISLLGAAAPRSSYDVVIVGGGGHGLATAYYLAARHGITNVAVLERSYIGAGNSGRNTTVIRANYGIPDAVAFYQRSLELYEGLEAELDRPVMHSTKGLLWLAHSEATLRTEKARAVLNTACGADTEFVEPAEIAQLCPQLDLTGDGKFPVLGASYHPRGATARHDRVVWGYAEGAMARGVHVHQGVGVTGLRARRRARDGRRDDGGAHQRRRGAGRRRRARDDARLDGRRAPADPHAPAAGRRHQPLPADARADRDLVRPARVRVADAARRVPVRRRDRPPGRLLVPVAATTSCRTARSAPSRCCRSCAGMRLLRQWVGVCDMSPDYSPIMGETGAEGFLITTGWGTWGFKAIPAGGEQMAATIAQGRPTDLIAPFALDRFERDRTRADRGSAGTH